MNFTEKLPSARQAFSNEEDSCNTLKVTPQFQKHIAKRLTKLLDKKLHDLISNKPTQNEMQETKKLKSCVKLFTNSTHYIKLEKPHKVARKRKLEDVSSDNEEKCKSVAVSGKDILNQIDTKHWSKRSKAKIYKYKKNNKGELVTTD